ncbi:hypothetical protein Ciccas_003023 [Cichlidogyrus casuarinus]|uniref:Uncharacterized protein n=1 Tax=Cichlidogyrus casuarinus TaxID=1844966 RepID=A0ABD2QIU8_9PLAT
MHRPKLFSVSVLKNFRIDNEEETTYSSRQPSAESQFDLQNAKQITRHTITEDETSKELILKVLKHYNISDQDKNLFYLVARRVAISQKGKVSLGSQSIKILDDSQISKRVDFTKLTLFVLNMRPGGLLRVFDERTENDSKNYLEIFVSKMTTTVEVISLIAKNMFPCEISTDLTIMEEGEDETNPEFKTTKPNICEEGSTDQDSGAEEIKKYSSWSHTKATDLVEFERKPLSFLDPYQNQGKMYCL